MMRSKTDWGSRTPGASTRLWVSLLWLLLSGCGNDAVRSDPCTAGATRVCVCSGGASGAQSCGSDGQYGLCQCSDSDGGGGPMDATTPGDGAATDAGGGGTTDTGGGVDIPRPAVGALGAACMRNGDCNSSLCLENGRCTRSCASESDCVAGWTCGVPTGGTGRFCLCSPTQEVCDGRDNDCDGLVDNGATCGSPGNVCTGGMCVCPASSLCGGTCRDLTRDVAHCGACGNACARNGLCVAGRCVCPEGRTLCGGLCVALTSDMAHCGSCGNACARNQTCLESRCACQQGNTLCGDLCRDIGRDVAHCGACGNACPDGQMCVAGRCECPRGQVFCSGSCMSLDLMRDVAHCGSCENVCEQGAICHAGVCRLCPAGMLPIYGSPTGALCMDRTEVTVAAYRSCPTCTAPGQCNWNRPGGDNLPIDCVDARQADAFCAWRGARLPYAREWQFAAQGPDGRTYPWGEAAPANQLCWSGAEFRYGACAVGSFPAGRSPFGLEDMSGNVAEWTFDTIDNLNGPRRGVHGGSWRVAAGFGFEVRTSSRFVGPINMRENWIGFRCARDQW